MVHLIFLNPKHFRDLFLFDFIPLVSVLCWTMNLGFPPVWWKWAPWKLIGVTPVGSTQESGLKSCKSSVVARHFVSRASFARGALLCAEQDKDLPGSF